MPLHQPFETALRGFNRRQVLEHLESLDGRIAMVTADRDAALTQVTELSKVLNHLRLESELLEHLRQEADAATSRVERILATPMTEASARIQRILRLAEEEAAELKAHAEAEIAHQRARADEEITRLRARASQEAKSLLEHAKRQCDQLEAESAARRKAAEQDAAQAIAQRESAANAQIRDREVRSVASVHLMLHVVGEQLSARVCAIDRDKSALCELQGQVADETTTLEALRIEVTAAVAAAHQLLVEALGQVHRAPAHKNTVEHSEVPVPQVPNQLQVPNQRGAESGTMHLLKASAEERRSPRTSR